MNSNNVNYVCSTKCLEDLRVCNTCVETWSVSSIVACSVMTFQSWKLNISAMYSDVKLTACQAYCNWYRQQFQSEYWLLPEQIVTWYQQLYHRPQTLETWYNRQNYTIIFGVYQCLINLISSGQLLSQNLPMESQTETKTHIYKENIEQSGFVWHVKNNEVKIK
jgi:hypothetical protein